jgi:S1-C subfamily serine protease
VEIVRELRPSVVHIQTELAPQGLFVLPTPSQGVGTGSVIDDQGHILTNNHVIEGARQITVALNDGRTFTASVVGADSFTDLAVLKVDAPNLAPARLGDSDKLEVGEDVVAIGYALDLDGGPTVTRGVVSAVGRSIEKSASVTLDGLIQTDAAINPGNSGGPLVNSRGEIVGVNTAVSGEAQGIGFAISINQAKAIAQQLLENGQVTRAYLGIRLATLAPAIARVNSLPVQRGVIVQTVDPNTPAARAGLRAGDIIVSMGGQAIPNSARLFRFLVENKPGTTVDIEYYRGANKTSGKITLGQRPAS